MSGSLYAVLRMFVLELVSDLISCSRCLVPSEMRVVHVPIGNQLHRLGKSDGMRIKPASPHPRQVPPRASGTVAAGVDHPKPITMDSDESRSRGSNTDG